MKKVFLTAVLFFAVFTFANADGIYKRVKFEKGTSSAIFIGAVVSGDVDTYILRAGKYEDLIVSVSSVKNNAVFTIIDDKTGKTLKGAGEDDKATDFKIELPRSGDYRIIVKPTIGNASYKLNIEVSKFLF